MLYLFSRRRATVCCPHVSRSCYVFRSEASPACRFLPKIHRVMGGHIHIEYYEIRRQCMLRRSPIYIACEDATLC